MAKPRNLRELATEFRTMHISGPDFARITRLGNVTIYQDGRKLCYQLYGTVIAERDLDTEQIEFSFGQGPQKYYTQTTANHMRHIAQVKPTLNYAGGYASYRDSGISRFNVTPNN